MHDTMNAADAGVGEILGKVEYRVVESGEGGVHCGAIKVGFEWVTQLTFSIILGAPRRTR